MKKIILGAVIILTGISLFAFIQVTRADTVWDLTGDYTIDFVCTSGCSGTWTHYMSVDTMNLTTGNFSGTGNYHPGTPTWTHTGNVSGSNVGFTVDYDGSIYFVDVVGTIASDGSMSGTANNASQNFTWSTTTGTATTFQRYAEITAPEENEIVYGEVEFAAYLVDNDEDPVQWAVRRGTCAMGTNTVLGNVDGHNDPYNWEYDAENYTHTFSATADTSGWVPGHYCFILNPREDSEETDIRETRNFYIADGYVKGGGQIKEEIGPKPKDDYKISFGGQVWDLGSGNYSGEWQINFHNTGDEDYDKSNFHATEITVINFYNGNSNTCDEAMNMTLLGTLDGEEGYKVIFRAGDYGMGNVNNDEIYDTVRVQLFNGNTEIYDTHDGDFTDESNCVGTARTGLDAGNITIEF